jgi:hypothetical protein
LASKYGDFPVLQLGDRVALRGRTASLSGERVVEIEDVGTIAVRGSCGTVQPARYATGAINSAIEGLLVEVSGSVASITPPYELELNDGSGNVAIVIDPTTHIGLPSLARGQVIRVVGVVSRSRGRSVIFPRYNSDLEARPVPTPTRTIVVPSATATRTATPTLSPPRATAPTTMTPTSSAAPTRALFSATPMPVAMLPTIDARAVVVVGSSTSIVASCTFFALALALWRRQK